MGDDIINMKRLTNRINGHLSEKDVKRQLKGCRKSVLESRVTIDNLKNSKEFGLKITGYLSEAQLIKIRIEEGGCEVGEGYNLLKKLKDINNDGGYNSNLKGWLDYGIEDLEEFLERYKHKV